MANQFGYACPECGDEDSLDVYATVAVRLCHDGTDCYEARNGDHEWEDDSRASCGCGWDGTVGQLVETGDEEDDGANGQDRESYSDTQDRESYTA